MEGAFYTLQDFMMHSKSVTYLLMVAALFAFVYYWRFLTDRDGDDEPEEHHGHGH